MGKKVKISATIDEELLDSFKKVLPDYITVSGLFETWIKEYMAGYYRHQWSVGEMIEVIRGNSSVEYLQKVHDLNLKGLPAREAAEAMQAEIGIQKQAEIEASKKKAKSKKTRG